MTWRPASLLAIVLGGCIGLQPNYQFPANPRTPEVAGVVEAVTQLPSGQWRHVLADGRVLEIDYRQTTSLLGGPQVGRLLLAGTDPDGRHWVAGIEPAGPGRPEGCFFLWTQGRLVDGSIDTTAGFRFVKARPFDGGTGPYNRFTSDRGGFCLNDRGEVTSYAVG